MLDNLRPTAAGLDGLPAWFLRVAAPIFCKTNAYLFNMSLATSAVPRQQTAAKIRQLPNVAAPTQRTDYRPISITPIMSRPMERTVVRTFLYPMFLDPSAVVVSSLTYASTAWRRFVTALDIQGVDAFLRFLPAESTRLQRAADEVRRPTFQ